MIDPINEALRAHVTNVGFSLSLGKTHVAALVMIDNILRWGVSFNGERAEDMRQVRDARAEFRMGLSGKRGLIERGLLVNLNPPSPPMWGNRRPGELWQITPAGHLVIGLLEEAGLWQEYASLLPEPPAEPEPRWDLPTIDAHGRCTACGEITDEDGGCPCAVAA